MHAKICTKLTVALTAPITENVQALLVEPEHGPLVQLENV
jgi:hypothetical protein